MSGALAVGDLVLWKPGLSRVEQYPELGVVCALPTAGTGNPEWIARVSDTGDPWVWGWSAWVSADEVEVVTDLASVPTKRLVTSIGLGGTAHGPAMLAEARRRQAEHNAATSGEARSDG